MPSSVGSATRLLVALVVLAATPGVAAGAVAPSSGATQPTPAVAADAGTDAVFAADAEANVTVSQTTTFRRTPARPGHVEVVVNYSLAPSVESLSVTVPAVRRGWATVRSSGGFARVTEGVYEYNGTGDPRLELSLSVSRRQFGSGQNGVDTGAWGLVETPRVSTTWQTAGPAGRLERSFRVDGLGVATPGYTYLGASIEHTQRVDNETIHLVVPATATPAAPPRRLLSVLALTNRLVPYGDPARDVYAFVMPTHGVDLGGTLGTTVGDSFWVRADESPTGPDTAWIHEYLHTRENVTLGRDATWLSEGIAEYYTAAIAVNAGTSSFPRTRSHLRGLGDTDDVLTRPDDWSDSLVSYRKGQRVVAALDARIRTETGGAATVAAVVRRMNAHAGPVSHDDAVGMVKSVAGPETAAWFDRQATTGLAPAIAADPHAYTIGPRRDPDRDDLPNAVERSLGTSPFEADSDGDGLPDGLELEVGTHPLIADSDGDGLLDGEEWDGDTDPLKVDGDPATAPGTSLVTPRQAPPDRETGSPGPTDATPATDGTPATPTTETIGPGPGAAGAALAVLFGVALLLWKRRP